MTFLRKLLFASALLGIAGPVAAQSHMDSQVAPTLPESTSPPVDELALKRDQADRLTVGVSVAGRGPFQFLVDTGSERTVISRELAARLALPRGERIQLHSVVGVKGVDTVYIPSLRVARNDIAVLDAPALAAGNIGADGMLGIDSLRSQRVLLDFKKGTLSITPTDEPSVRLEGDSIVVRAKTRKGRLIFTDAQVADRKVVVIVDTGSEVTIGNMALRRALERRNIKTIEAPVLIESVTGDSLEAKVTRLSRLQIGGLDVTDLAVAFVDAHLFRQLDLMDRPALLLGMNALKAFDKIQIDFARKRVRFVLPGTSMRKMVRMAAND